MGVESGDDWEYRFCPSEFCKVEVWLVTRHDLKAELWRVTAGAGNRPWIVAAIGPVCPYCGESLLTAVELEEGIGQSTDEDQEEGPLFEFLETLAV
jgi:hypothetical protein